MSGGRAAAVWSAGTGGGAAAGRRLQPAVGSGTGGSGGGEGSTERSRRRVRAAEAAGGRRAPDPAAFSPTLPPRDAEAAGGVGPGRAGCSPWGQRCLFPLSSLLPAPGGGWEAGGRGLSERGPPGVERGRQGAAAAPRKRVRRGGCGPGLPEFPGPSGGRTEGVNAPSEVDPRAAAARRSVSNLPRGAAAASGRPAGPWGEPGVL